MSDVLYIANPSLSVVEERAVDACLWLAEEGGLRARVQRLPTDEPNSVKLSVLMFPPLLDPFERVAWRRTFHWGARHWRLPPGLLGTRFVYRRQEYEFVGATLRSGHPHGYFVTVRRADEWIMQVGEVFVRDVILPEMPKGPTLTGRFSVGLGEKERIFA